MIYTTYFAKLKKLPKEIIPIAICAKPPAGYDGPLYRALAPKYDFFKQWQITRNNEIFIENYIGQVLKQLNPVKVVSELYYQVGAAPCSCDIALVCYEKSTDFCHRHLVADWLRDSGYQCEEF
jgi:hypothetical protein